MYLFLFLYSIYYRILVLSDSYIELFVIYNPMEKALFTKINQNKDLSTRILSNAFI